MKPSLIPINFKPSFEKPEYIDGFLSEEEHIRLKRIVMNENEKSFPFFHQKSVAYSTDDTPNWSWMGIHQFYANGEPRSPFYELIKELFFTKLYDMKILHAMIRVKGNFYPWTPEVYNHPWHNDYDTRNFGAVYSINTCDGFTEFEDGTKVDSVANRMLFFDSSVLHRSSTCTTDYGRYNINFNFL